MKATWQISEGDSVQHLYLYPYGYPIRLCNWTYPRGEIIESKTNTKCKHCQLELDGKRQTCFAPKEIELAEMESEL